MQKVEVVIKAIQHHFESGRTSARLSPTLRKEAVKYILAAGLSNRKAGEVFGVNKGTIARWKADEETTVLNSPCIELGTLDLPKLQDTVHSLSDTLLRVSQELKETQDKLNLLSETLTQGVSEIKNVQLGD